MIGRRFGKLLVIERVPSPYHVTMWRCRCDCGATTITRGTHLRSGHSRSCGCGRQAFTETGAQMAVPMIGKRFGMLVVIARARIAPALQRSALRDMAMHLLVRKRQGRCRAPPASWLAAIVWVSSAGDWPLQAAEEELAVSYFVFPLALAGGRRPCMLRCVRRCSAPALGRPLLSYFHGCTSLHTLGLSEHRPVWSWPGTTRSRRLLKQSQPSSWVAPKAIPHQRSVALRAE